MKKQTVNQQATIEQAATAIAAEYESHGISVDSMACELKYTLQQRGIAISHMTAAEAINMALDRAGADGARSLDADERS